VVDLTRAGQVRIRSEKLLNACVHGDSKAILCLGAAQHLLFGRIADEGGFDQNRGHIGRSQHCKACIFDLRLVQTVNVPELVQHIRGQLRGVFDLGRGREVQQNFGNLLILSLNVDAANQISRVFFFSEPFCSSTRGAALGQDID